MALTRGGTGGGTWFKPADHMNDIALLVEVKRIEDNVPNNYNGQTTHRDIATADISVFATSEDVQKKEPSKVLKGAKFSQKALVSECREKVGEPFVSVIRKVPMGAGSGYVFRGNEQEVPGSVFDAVAAYLEGREAEEKANLEDAPDFD